MRMLSAFSNARIVLIGNGEVASFRKNHSVVISSLVVALVPGDLALLVLGSCSAAFCSSLVLVGCNLGARFQRLLPVTYSEIWYSGFGWFWWSLVMAASKACIAVLALGDLEARDLETLVWLRNL